MTSVPVIDLTDCFSGVRGAQAAAAGEVRSALEEVGFLSIVGHGIDWSIVEDIYGQAVRFHALDEDTKAAIPMSASLMGYVGLGGAQRGDRPAALNAAFFMGRPGSKRNQFPDPMSLPGFQEAASRYYEAMDSMCHRLLALYALAAEMPAGYFDGYFDPALATLRITEYPAVRAAEDQWGIDPHTDAGFMTLLPSNPLDGLQIRPAGADWFPINQEPRSFVVNSGDMLRRWSNDRFLSTTHRAINEAGKTRYAIPFFFDPRVDAVIEALSACVPDGEAPRHEPLRYGDYLRSFMNEGYAQTALGSSVDS